MKRFLEQQPQFPKTRHGHVTHQQTYRILTNPLYAGYLTIAKWDLHLVPAKHEALVGFETYRRVQDRLNGTAAYAPARKDINEDFPLRGFITCACCDKPMTASWSKGRSQRYPYYMCFTKGCDAYRKSIKRDVVEGEFEELLKQLKPAANLFTMAFEMFRDLWEAKVQAAEADKAAIEKQISQLDRKFNQTVDRILDTEDEVIRTAFETRLKDMKAQKVFLTEQLSQIGKPSVPFSDAFRTAFDFLANPWNLWNSDRIEDKRAVLKLVFADRLAYCRKTGVRTAKNHLALQGLSSFFDHEVQVAERQGFEPWRRFPAYTLSRRAPSTTRPPLREAPFSCGAPRSSRGFFAD